MRKIIFILSGILASVGAMQAQTPNNAAASSQLSSQYDSETLSVEATSKYKTSEGTAHFSDLEAIETHVVSRASQPSTIVNQRGVAAMQTFNIRNTFMTAYSGTLVQEDFSGGPGAGQIQDCGDTISNSGDNCFGVGVLEEGFKITSGNNGSMIYIGVGALGNTSTLIGADSFADFTILSFEPQGVYGVGFDMFVDSDPDVLVRIYDTSDNLLRAFMINNTPNTENFFGVITTDPIGKIELEGQNDAGELFGNLAFGSDAQGGDLGCGGVNPNDGTFIDGLNCSSATAMKTFNDLVVAVGEKFTLEEITATIFTTTAIASVDVIYYEDNAGLPGAIIGSQNDVNINSQSIIGTNFGYNAVEVKLGVDPFLFNGQAGRPTVYWIELSVTDSQSSEMVFWVITTSTMVNHPSVLYNSSGVLEVFDVDFDGVYMFEGQCEDILAIADNELNGFQFYPNPTTDVIQLSASKNIEFVSIYNLMGQKVMHINVESISSALNVTELATGTYVMKVSVDGEMGTYKFIKN